MRGYRFMGYGPSRVGGVLHPHGTANWTDCGAFRRLALACARCGLYGVHSFPQDDSDEPRVRAYLEKNMVATDAGWVCPGCIRRKLGPLEALARVCAVIGDIGKWRRIAEASLAVLAREHEHRAVYRYRDHVPEDNQDRISAEWSRLVREKVALLVPPGPRVYCQTEED